MSEEEAEKVKIQVILEDISRHLVELVEKVLEEQTFMKFYAILQQQEQMIKALQIRMTSLIQNKIDQLSSRIAVNEGERDQSPSNKSHNSSFSKSERKEIVEDILSIQKIKSAKLFKEAEQSKNISIQSINETASLSISKEIDEIRAKLKHLERNYQLKFKKIEESVSICFNEVGRITQKQVQFRLSYEEKVQLNLQSLWNVITNIQAHFPIDYRQEKSGY